WGGGEGRVGLLGERNRLRYRPCRGVLVRAEVASVAGRRALAQVLFAARTCGVAVAVSLADGAPERWRHGHSAVDVETEAELHARLASGHFERLRALVPVSRETRTAAHAAGVTVL